MLADLGSVRSGDVVILHGCCHNPTGADPDADLWDQIADVLARTGAIPLIDIAYQGFGNGLEEDAAGYAPDRLAAAGGSDRGLLLEELRGLS